MAASGSAICAKVIAERGSRSALAHEQRLPLALTEQGARSVGVLDYLRGRCARLCYAVDSCDRGRGGLFIDSNTEKERTSWQNVLSTCAVSLVNLGPPCYCWQHRMQPWHRQMQQPDPRHPPSFRSESHCPHPHQHPQAVPCSARLSPPPRSLRPAGRRAMLSTRLSAHTERRQK
jgi:hypothetical protein